jgi:ribosome-associated heat shock protein Hsp15
VDPAGDIRIDKWLWAARVFKTRMLALEACHAGHVKIGDHAVKPARPVRVGETITARAPSGVMRTLRVVGVSDRRVGPKLVGTFFEDLTPPEEIARVQRSVVEQVLARPKGAGRPTKRERRQIDRWMP